MLSTVEVLAQFGWGQPERLVELPKDLRARKIVKFVGAKKFLRRALRSPDARKARRVPLDFQFDGSLERSGRSPFLLDKRFSQKGRRRPEERTIGTK